MGNCRPSNKPWHEWLSLTIGFALLLTPAVAGAGDPSSWTYSVKRGEERSSRSYLLVNRPGDASEQRIRVRSVCRRPFPAEGAYGRCEHTLVIFPGARHLRLQTGEDVGIVRFTWGMPLLLATIEYGCCGGPWTARLYDERGKFLGLTRGFKPAAGAVGDNLITRTYDFGNGTRYDKQSVYLLVSPEGKATDIRRMDVVLFRGATHVRQPIHVPPPDPAECEEWVVSDFVAYGDRKDITLKLEGGPCSVPEKSFSCDVAHDSLECRAATPAAN